jgi:PBP1b-binding outer membrane lipoprotein LpoB
LKPITKILIVVLTTSLILVGCSQQASPSQTVDMQTAIAGTLSVMQTQINITPNQPVAAATTQAPTAEPTQAPTITPAPTDMPTATAVAVIATAAPNDPVTGSTGPSYRVGNVKALLFPTKTYVNTNLNFTEIFSITNVGTATWLANTKVISADDNMFALANGVTIGQVVSNGQSVELHLNLKAPEAVNNYTVKFMLETPDGKKFGVGSNFDQPFSVIFYVH